MEATILFLERKDAWIMIFRRAYGRRKPWRKKEKTNCFDVSEIYSHSDGGDHSIFVQVFEQWELQDLVIGPNKSTGIEKVDEEINELEHAFWKKYNDCFPV